MKRIKIGVAILSLLAFSQVDAQEKKAKKGPEVAFEKLDTDKDGKLSLEEFKARTIKSKPGAENSKPVNHEKAFTRKDANADGFIDMEEFKARPEKKK
ncbi:EF-hand domain-containing protein [Mariniflexile ostreae]|uniref:EF-hand domain-containing protein n=1 Tax=Mariniflexile ostreae TaxID=1520892 RepID=A0ABV5FCM0_9FLAO